MQKLIMTRLEKNSLLYGEHFLGFYCHPTFHHDDICQDEFYISNSNMGENELGVNLI